MKNLLFILIIACLIVACEEGTNSLDIDNLNSQEFNQLLATGQGLDILVKAAQDKNIDYDELEEKLSTTYTITLLNSFYVFADNNWENSVKLGGGNKIFTMSPNKTAVRKCFIRNSLMNEDKLYRDYPIETTIMDVVINQTFDNEGKIIAKLNDTTYVLEGKIDDSIVRQLAMLTENRDWILENYCTAL